MRDWHKRSMWMSVESDNPDALFYGRYSDGKTATSKDADVRLGTRGVEILLSGAPHPNLWPYETLSSAEPLTDHAVDALLTSTAEPGASLFVGEGTFARRLRTRAPQLSVRAQRWRHARPWLAATAGLALVTAAVWLFDLSPSHAVANLLPDSVRVSMGRQVIQSMTGDRGECVAEAGRKALDRLTARLSDAAGGGASFSVVVSDWGLVNAFAAPGEQIVLTRGLLAQAESGDEIAGVLAHEMGHGLERHPETGIVRAIGLAAAFDLMMGGSSGTLGNAGLFLAQLSYSRAAEREADTQALRVLKTAGVANRGLSTFFRRVVRLEGETRIGKAISSIEVLRTHPMTEERIRSVETTAPYAATPAMPPADFAALKTICSKKRGTQGSAEETPNTEPKSAGPERDI